MLGDWLRRASGRKRLGADTSNGSARKSLDEYCLNVTPINRGEKFKSIILPHRQCPQSG
jgi:hypothetical protein